jgi:hypothetical protein
LHISELFALRYIYAEHAQIVVFKVKTANPRSTTTSMQVGAMSVRLEIKTRAKSGKNSSNILSVISRLGGWQEKFLAT